jgi:two-component system, NtrC family, response regulator HydG
MARTVIVADDDPEILALLSLHLKSWNFRVQTASSKGELLETLAKQSFSALILDLQFGDHDGIEVLTQLFQQGIKQQTIFLTGCGTIERAVQAIKVGAVDFLTKPADLLRLRQLLEHIVSNPNRERGRSKPSTTSNASTGTSSIIGKSEAICQLRQLIEDVAQTDAKALILGETGTGKELVARELHQLGRRSAGPYVPVNMAALPDTLAESVMFGHRKGAFTGAETDQIGCCEAAHKGTLFLDEIGEMPLPLQAKLLRFLQGNNFQRIGSVETISVDVRVLAATNLTPQQMLEGGKLREDLYYRLNVIPIQVPPLRERAGDASLLAQHFLASQVAERGSRELQFATETLSVLEKYRWPGNVRELEGLVERLSITTKGNVITPADLPDHFSKGQSTCFRIQTDFETPRQANTPMTPMESLQMQAITDALERASGNVVVASKILGVGQATMYRKIKRYGLTLPSVSARTNNQSE